jgi:8-hydroxy-5-deazaflavin:NADPH oxidoreductase
VDPWCEPSTRRTSLTIVTTVTRTTTDVENLRVHAAGGTTLSAPQGAESAGSVVTGALPQGAHYVKAFGTLGAGSLATAARRVPRAVLFYATDDDAAAAAVERLITGIGFEPFKVGGVAEAGRIEVPGGDLHESGGLGGRLLDIDEARAAVAASPATA